MVEHMIPLSRNGKTNHDNCVTACSDCNTQKAQRTPEEASMPLKFGRYKKKEA